MREGGGGVPALRCSVRSAAGPQASVRTVGVSRSWTAGPGTTGTPPSQRWPAPASDKPEPRGLGTEGRVEGWARTGRGKEERRGGKKDGWGARERNTEEEAQGETVYSKCRRPSFQGSHSAPTSAPGSLRGRAAE